MTKQTSDTLWMKPFPLLIIRLLIFLGGRKMTITNLSGTYLSVFIFNKTFVQRSIFKIQKGQPVDKDLLELAKGIEQQEFKDDPEWAKGMADKLSQLED